MPNFVQPYTFTARELDVETRAVLLSARYYDHAIGRFLQTDPIDISGGLNLYTYSANIPTNRIDPFGLDFLDVAANYSAGFGDEITFGITRYVRVKMGINDVVDECSLSYSLGGWSGILHGIATGTAGSLHGGARTVLWSGAGAEQAAQAAKGTGKLLTDTPLGKLLDVVDDYVKLPQPIWDAASGVFAANAKGNVRAFLRDPAPEGVWNTVERPALDFVNRVNIAVSGLPVTRIVKQ